MANRKRVHRKADVPASGTDYSLWTSPPSAWKTPFDAARPIPDIDKALKGLKLADEKDDELLAAFQTAVTVDVMSLPTQDPDGSPWRTD